MKTLATWPLVDDQRRGHVQEWWQEGGGWQDYLKNAQTPLLTEAKYLRKAQRLWEAIGDRVAGRKNEVRTTLVDLARELQVPLDLNWVTHPAPDLSWVPDTATLARIAADHLPGVGMDGPCGLLGPWNEELDIRQPQHRHAMWVAMAAWCFALPEAGGKRPCDFWTRGKPRVEATVRDCVVRAGRAPMNLWRISSLQEGNAQLTDWTGWYARNKVSSAPHTVEVMLGEVAGVQTGPEEGGGLVGRIVRGPKGLVVLHGFAMAALPDQSVVQSWLNLLLMQTRLFYRTATVQAVLRYRGQVLCRWAHEWLWHRANGMD